MRHKHKFTIAVIGGYGKMGLWTARYLHNKGFPVVIYGRKAESSVRAAAELGVASVDSLSKLSDCDALMLSVPMKAIEATVKELAASIKPDQQVYDLSSLRVKNSEIIKGNLKQNIAMGIHPMFGPGAKDLYGQKIIVTATGKQEDAIARKIKNFLEKDGAIVSIMTPQEHDELMSIVLGLAHFIALVSADTLFSLGKLKESIMTTGTTYRALLTIFESVLSEDPDFYSYLQMNLPGMSDIHDLFKTKSGQWAELVRNKDTAAFISRMKQLKDDFSIADPDFSNAYQNLYKLFQ